MDWQGGEATIRFQASMWRALATPMCQRATCIEFRVGITLGDIIIGGDVIFRDGVAVVARLEPLAEPGGNCVSRVVRDELAFALDPAASTAR